MNIFVTQILFLLAVVSTFTYYFSYENEIFKREEYDGEKELMKTVELLSGGITQECDNAINKLLSSEEECSIIDYNNKLDFYPEKKNEFCTLLLSDKCKKIFTASLTDLSECKDSEKYSVYYTEILIKSQYYKAINKHCFYDEKGNECPFSDKKSKEIMGKVNKYKEYKEEVLKQTCKSQKCLDYLYTFIFEMLRLTKKFDQEVDESERLINEDKTKLKVNYEKTNEQLNYFRNNSCKASSSLETQYLELTDTNAESQNDQTSGALSLTYSYVLLIISLIFSLLNVF